ncbi:MAG TPA: MnhB domain-containing protein [Opitutaceae bacterium]
MKSGDSLILRAVTALLFFLINVFAVYLLMRGHNLPGGGFIGGLGSALSFILLSLAFGVERAQRTLRADPVRIAGTGLLLAIGAACLPLLGGDPFLRHYHVKLTAVPLAGDLSFGTPLLFDAGVFLVVVGVSTKLIFLLSRSLSGLTAIADEERDRYSARPELPVESTEPRSGPEGRNL